MKHYFFVIIKILKSSYSYSKIQVLVCYCKLLIASYRQANFSKRKMTLGPFNENILGYCVTFYNYPKFINLFEEIFIYQCYFFDSEIESPLLIDCGSNIGISILYFKKLYPLSRIMCFEPDKDTFDILLKNIQENNLKDIQLFNYALSDKEAVTPMYKESLSEGSLNTSLYNLSNNSKVINTSTKLLSDLITAPVEFLKMDIEGAENLALKDLCQTLKINMIKKLIIEYHPYCNISLNELLEMLKQYGFRNKIMDINLHSDAPETLILAYK